MKKIERFINRNSQRAIHIFLLYHPFYSTHYTFNIIIRFPPKRVKKHLDFKHFNMSRETTKRNLENRKAERKYALIQGAHNKQKHNKKLKTKSGKSYV